MSVRSRPESDVTRPSACTAIIEALDEYSDFDFQATGSTLYDFVDAEALDSLFDHNPDANVSVQFEIHDATVTVWKEDGEVSARVDDRTE